MKFRPYFYSLLSTAIPNALGFVLFPLYAKALGPADYGTVALLEAYQGVLSILLFLGMTTAFYVYYSHAKDEFEERQVFATSLFFGFLILGVVGLIALFSPQIATTLSGMGSATFISIYLFALFSDYMLTIANTYLRVECQIGMIAMNAILISLVHHGLSFYVVVLMGGGLASFITIFFITKSVALLIVAYYVWRDKLSLSGNFIDYGLLKKMLKFGSPLILTAITGWILLLSDRLFINYYVTTADVGIYAVAYKFAMGLWIGIVQPFMTVWEPTLFNVYLQDARQGYEKLRKDFTYYLGGIAIIFGGFLLFIDEILDFLFSHSAYSHDSTIIYLLAASYFLMAIGEMLGSVCRLHKTSKFAFWVTLTAVSLKLTLNFTLIPTYLLIGAAAASVISEFASQIIMAWFAVRLSPTFRIFFSPINLILFSLFCIIEALLFLNPHLAFFVKFLLFLGLLMIVGCCLFLSARTCFSIKAIDQL